ncbi:hypothetical protein [Paraburkholderia sp. D1E]|uniref:hypothetical protein n=1 Tax=Paraburkholderia sp. D1E TaxID=3461398 RepID=UPI004045D636
MEQRFEYFGKAPKLWPDRIAFYQMRGDNKQSKGTAAACAIALPDYRHACRDASQTLVEIAANKAKSDAHANVIVQNVELKLFK